MKRKHISFIIFGIGLLVIAYPWIMRPFTFMEEINAVNEYYEMVDDLDPKEEQELVEEYEYYNELLAGEDVDGNFISQEELDNLDRDELDYKNSGSNSAIADDVDREISKKGFTNGRILGAIRIPKLNLKIPIYQGATVENLWSGVGHVSGTSLPTGEIGSHSVIAGHNRLRNKKLFTTIHKLNKGDVFKVDSLGKEMNYEVVDMIVVEPYETDYLMPVEGKDKVTLLTCSDFGEKRLLVMGERKK